MEHIIKYQPVKLSDGSLFYSLIIGGVTFEAISERHADLFVNGLRTLAERHTNDTTREIYMEPITG